MKNLIFVLLLVSVGVQAQQTKGLVTIGTMAPTDSLDEYFTHDDYFGKTANKIVKTKVQRDNIPIARRMKGMRVFVQDEKNTYRLEDCLDNNCWIVDRIDTLKNGTVSTGKITVQAYNNDPSFLYDAYTFNGYQRFGITKNGTLISGRRMPAYINADALAVIGDRNEMLATDGFAMGKDVKVNGDTSAAIGYNLESTYFNSLLIGRGKDRANRVKNRWPFSTSIGAFQAVPQIELTKDTIRLNSNVLWWNGAPISSGGGSFQYAKTLDSSVNWKVGDKMFYLMGRDANTAITFNHVLANYPSFNALLYNAASNTRMSFDVKPSGVIFQYNKVGVLTEALFDDRGFLFPDNNRVDTSKFVNNSLVTKRWVLDRIGSGGSSSLTNGFLKASGSTFNPYADSTGTGSTNGLYLGNQTPSKLTYLTLNASLRASQLEIENTSLGSSYNVSIVPNMLAIWMPNYTSKMTGQYFNVKGTVEDAQFWGNPGSLSITNAAYNTYYMVLDPFANNIENTIAYRLGTKNNLTATNARLVTFENATGDVKSQINSDGQYENTTAGNGIILKSPDGTRYRITVANGGTLTVTAL